MSNHGIGLTDGEPLVVSPKGAARLLDLGVTKIYELIRRGEIRTYRDGASRKILVCSLRDYVQRKLAQAA